jgi:hypothetical protein
MGLIILGGDGLDGFGCVAGRSLPEHLERGEKDEDDGRKE